MNSKDFYRSWRYIEKSAFLPTGEKEIRSWLHCFGLFLNRALQVGDRFPKIVKKNGLFIYKVIHTPRNVTLECRIKKEMTGFSFLIEWRDFSVQFEYDNRYTCEFDYLEEHCSEMRSDFNKEQLKEVLENKIHHPALHYHIKHDRNSLPHDIRLAAAAKNPFLLLYQAAYQFLHFLGGEKKQQELKRLTDVIFQNKDQMPIASGKLFGI